VGFSATIERREQDGYVVALEGDLALSDAGRLKKVLFELIADGADAIEIDLRRVTLLDATAAGVLIIAERALHRRGGTLRLRGWGRDEFARLAALNGANPNGSGATRPRLLFFQARGSDETRRIDGFLASVLRRQRDESFKVQRVVIEDHPDLAARFGVAGEPTLFVIEGNHVRARIANPREAHELERVLAPWLGRASVQ
jgi:anti-anti-sigma factor